MSLASHGSWLRRSSDHARQRARGAWRLDAIARGIRIASVLFITALTAAAAQISVPLPFTQVPFTLQPMVVLLGGLALGSRLGSASQILYLAAGIAGLPVFAASATLPPGALRLLGPTGGYLMAYPLAASSPATSPSAGSIAATSRPCSRCSPACVVIYACGVHVARSLRAHR